MKKLEILTYYDSSGQSEYGFTKPYSEQTAELIDKEISDIIEKQYQRAIELLTNNKEKLNLLSRSIIRKEVIFKDNLRKDIWKKTF